MNQIEKLPTIQDLPTRDEEELISVLYDPPIRQAQKVYHGFREEILQMGIIVVLFLVFTWSRTEEWIRNLVPITQNSVIMMQFFKIVAVLVLFVMLNHYLVRPR
jgi:hypothetical protein